MRGRVFSLCLIPCLLGAASAASVERLSLKRSAELIIAGSHPVQMAAEAVTGAELKVSESRSPYWPLVNVSVNYTRMSLFGEFQFPIGGEVRTIKFGTPNNYSLRGSLVEQVFNWGRTARSVEMSRAGLDLAQDGLDVARFQTAYQVVPLYFGTVFFLEAIKVLDDALEAFARKLEIMDQRFREGLASSFETNLIQVQMSAIQAQKLDFENNLNKSRIAFNSLAGRDPAAAFVPEAALAQEPVDLDREAWVREALSSRLELRQAAHQVALNRASLGLARTGDKPTLTASFNYEFRNGFMPEMDKIKGNWTALLSVSTPVFDGFRVSSQVAQAESVLRSAETKRADLERSVTMEVDAALSDLRTIEQKIGVEKTKVRQAEEALRIAEERQANGLLSATDLVDAQNALESSRLNVLQLVYGHILSRYTLYRACGRSL